MPATEYDNDNANADPANGRYVYEPATGATLNLAATAAQCARIWQDLDPEFSAKCLTAAEKAWTAALAHPDLLAGNTPGAGGGNYEDADVSDEFSWAAAELYLTTQDAGVSRPGQGRSAAQPCLDRRLLVDVLGRYGGAGRDLAGDGGRQCRSTSS